MRSSGRVMRALFIVYVTVICIGLVYFASIGLLRR
jgi:hypothetical protein